MSAVPSSSTPPSRQTLVTRRSRLPSAYARRMRSRGTSRRLCFSTSAGVMPASIATLASAAALQAASQPSMSWLGSASANPSSWVCFKAVSNGAPCAIASMMKLVVLLKTASKPSRRQSTSVNSSRLKTGKPSITVLSKRMRRPVAAAFAAIRRQFQAMGPLFAVTTSMPRSNAVSMWPVATGAWSSSMTVSSTRTSAPEAARRSRGGRGGSGSGAPLGAAANAAPAVTPSGASRLPRRVPAPVIRTRRPCFRPRASCCRSSRSQNPRATAPKPSRQSLTVRRSALIASPSVRDHVARVPHRVAPGRHRVAPGRQRVAPGRQRVARVRGRIAPCPRAGWRPPCQRTAEARLCTASRSRSSSSFVV